MKKTYQTIVATLLIIFCFTAIVAISDAAVINPSIKSVTAKTGSTFTVRYAIDPQGEAVYTTKLQGKFPPGIVSLKSFNFTEGMIPLSQPGYDAINNTTGTFTKTAGYPKGISAYTVFGTATFSVIGVGSGEIILNNESFILNATDKNVLTSLPSATVVIDAGRAVTPQVTKTIEETPPVLFDVIATPTPVEKQSIPWLFMLVLILIILVIYWLYRRYRHYRFEQQVKHLKK